MFALVDLGHAAAPSLVLEHGPVTLRKLPVEPAVVGDHDDRVFDEGHDRRAGLDVELTLDVAVAVADDGTEMGVATGDDAGACEGAGEGE